MAQEYGKPDEIKVQKLQNKLGNQLLGSFCFPISSALSHESALDLELYQYDEQQGDAQAEISHTPEAILRVLPNMTLRVLRLKICKVLKRDPRSTAIMFWLRMAHRNLARLDNEQDSRDLDWLGLENNSHIIYRIT